MVSHYFFLIGDFVNIFEDLNTFKYRCRTNHVQPWRVYHPNRSSLYQNSDFLSQHDFVSASSSCVFPTNQFCSTPGFHLGDAKPASSSRRRDATPRARVAAEPAAKVEAQPFGTKNGGNSWPLECECLEVFWEFMFVFWDFFVVKINFSFVAVSFDDIWVFVAGFLSQNVDIGMTKPNWNWDHFFRQDVFFIGTVLVDFWYKKSSISATKHYALPCPSGEEWGWKPSPLGLCSRW